MDALGHPLLDGTTGLRSATNVRTPLASTEFLTNYIYVAERPYDPRPYDSRYTRGGGGGGGGGGRGGYDDYGPPRARRAAYDDDHRGGGSGGGGGRDYDRGGYRDYDRGYDRGYDRSRYDDRRY